MYKFLKFCVNQIVPIKNKLTNLNNRLLPLRKHNFHVNQMVNKDFFANRSDELFDIDDEQNAVLNIITYNKKDPVINSLLSSTTVQDVLNTLSNNQDNLKKEHLVQSALVLWHLQNVFVKIQTQLDTLTDVTEAQYVAKLKNEPQFQNLLKNIEKTVDCFDIDELTCSLLYLSKMEVKKFNFDGGLLSCFRLI